MGGGDIDLSPLDAPFVKAPLEEFKRLSRDTFKILEREIGGVISQVNKLNPKDPSELAKLPKMSSKLRALREKISHATNEGNGLLNRSYIRVQHAESTGEGDSHSTKVNRLILDYFLRREHFETANKMLEAKPQISDYVDSDLFITLKKIENSLRVEKTCKLALSWCSVNKAGLKAIKSDLEMRLRLCEYVCLIRKRLLTEAIQYSQKYFSDWIVKYQKDVQQAMAMLTFSTGVSNCIYRPMFSEEVWDTLADKFIKESHIVYGLSKEVQLVQYVNASLAAMKTPSCFIDDLKMPNCPVCQPPFNEMARTLPFSHHETSCIICRLSGATIDDKNPPLVLPNGHVYSYAALEEMAEKNKGKVTCITTGDVFPFSETRKCYIA